MLISIDFVRLQAHLSVLQEEKAAALRLNEMLSMPDAVVFFPDLSLLSTQQKSIEEELSYIQQRIHILESTIDTFRKLSLRMDEDLQNSLSILRNAEAY